MADINRNRVVFSQDVCFAISDDMLFPEGTARTLNCKFETESSKAISHDRQGLLLHDVANLDQPTIVPVHDVGSTYDFRAISCRSPSARLLNSVCGLVAN